MKANLMNNFTKNFEKVKFGVKKHKSEILLATGIVCGIGTVVMACKSTLETNKILEETKINVDEVETKIKEVVENEGNEDKESIDDILTGYNKEKTYIYAQAGIKVVKVYLPSFALGFVSIATILASHNVIKQRYVGAVAACGVITKDFVNYRAGVIKKYGEEADTELRHGVKKEKIEKIIVDEETGKEKKVKETVNIVEKNPYAFTFRKGNPNWCDNMDYNLQFIMAQEKYATNLLISRGNLFLNEVADLLGLERTKMGQVVGWKYNPNDPDCDCEVKFRAYVAYEKDDFGNIEEVVRFDFNVDGTILDTVLE